MGSTFGKVKKYSVNHSGDPATCRYSVGMDEDGKSLEFPQSSEKGGLNGFNKGSHNERPRFYHPKEKTPDDSMSMFSVGYPTSSHAEQHGLRVTENLLIPPKLPFKSHKRTKEEVQRPYDFSDQDIHTAMETVLKTTFGPSERPENISSIKPDSAMDPNPKPYQKVYTAEDINKLLKPLQILNAKLSSLQSYHSLLNQDRYSKHAPAMNQHTFNSVPHICCNHQSSSFASEGNQLPNPPPPYSDTSQKRFELASRTSSSSQYNTYVSNKHKPPNSNDPVFSSNIKYNTIHNDGRIPLHLRKEFNMFSSSKSPSSSRNHWKNPSVENVSSNNSNASVPPQNTHMRTSSDKYEDIRFRRDSDYIRRTAFFDQRPHVDSHIYNKTLSQTHYTIPEETAWPPPFSYNTMQAASYRPKF